MVDHTNPNPNSPFSPSQFGDHPISGPQWIRAAADGEADGLTRPSDLPSDVDARLVFDRTLRDYCSRTSGSVKCPDSVRQAVMSAMAAESLTPAGAPSGMADHRPITTPMGDTRSRSFWAGVGRFGAIAAVVVLGASLIYKGVSTGTGGHALPIPQASLLASFVEDRHEHCPTNTKDMVAEFAAHTEEAARAACLEHLGIEPPHLIAAIRSMRNASFEFVGLALCDVPGQGPSVHLMFRATNELAPARASLFIQRDSEQLNIRSSACYLTGCPKRGQLIAWRTEGFVNYLYACTAPALASARNTLSVPAAEKPL